jgi:hypothetical protein
MLLEKLRKKSLNEISSVVKLKPFPEIATWDMVRLAVPVFVTVISRRSPGLLRTLPKLIEVGDTTM